jgi:hypothetical protein
VDFELLFVTNGGRGERKEAGQARSLIGGEKKKGNEESHVDNNTFASFPYPYLLSRPPPTQNPPSSTAYDDDDNNAATCGFRKSLPASSRCSSTSTSPRQAASAPAAAAAATAAAAVDLPQQKTRSNAARPSDATRRAEEGARPQSPCSCFACAWWWWWWWRRWVGGWYVVGWVGEGGNYAEGKKKRRMGLPPPRRKHTQTPQFRRFHPPPQRPEPTTSHGKRTGDGRTYMEGRRLPVRKRAVVHRHEERPWVAGPHLLRRHQQLRRRRRLRPAVAPLARCSGGLLFVGQSVGRSVGWLVGLNGMDGLRCRRSADREKERERQRERERKGEGKWDLCLHIYTCTHSHILVTHASHHITSHHITSHHITA